MHRSTIEPLIIKSDTEMVRRENIADESCCCVTWAWPCMSAGLCPLTKFEVVPRSSRALNGSHLLGPEGGGGASKPGYECSDLNR